MRIVDLSFLGQLFVCKLSKNRQGVCLVDWTEVDPCKLSTVVPVEEHTRLVSPGQDTCDLDGGVEFLLDLCWQWILSEQVFYFLPCVGA